MSERSILDISAVAPERQEVRIRTKVDPDGTIYEVVAPEELSTRAAREFGQRAVRMLELWEGADDDSKEKRLVTLLNQLVGTMIPDAPKPVLRAIPKQTKRALVIGFLGRFGELAMEGMTEAQLGKFLSGTQSLDSSGSTEEALTTG